MPMQTKTDDVNKPSGPYCSLQHLMELRWAIKNINLPKAKKASRPQSGSHQSRFRGRGMEFSEVRVYQPGDDVRSIDWRVTARRQTPHTKLFNEERERPLLIICDQSQSQFFGSKRAFKSVRAAETAALFAWAALDHNDRVGGIVFSEKGHNEVKPARNRKSTMRLLNYITHFNNRLSINDSVDINSTSSMKAFTFNDALTEAIRLAKPGTMIVLISDFLHIDTDTDKYLSKLAKHNELLMIRTFDPLEEQLPPPGLYPVSNGVETLLINSKSKQTRQNYLNWVNDHKARLTSLSHRVKGRLIEVSTEQEPDVSLQKVLHILKTL
jgi:uncharacterized protein (DUF58 family)